MGAMRGPSCEPFVLSGVALL
ncbi:protein of unknown function (plasmid) [Caballeronia sp. S22]